MKDGFRQIGFRQINFELVIFQWTVISFSPGEVHPIGVRGERFLDHPVVESRRTASTTIRELGDTK